MNADLKFDSDVRRRIYEYVEEQGAADREDVRGAVRVEPDRGGSKPTRSAVAETVRLTRADLHDHVRALVETGHLEEVDGKLRVAVEASPETFELDDGTPVTVRLAHEADSEGVRSVMGDVVAERTSIVAESIAEALDDEPVLRRTRRRSRVFFVATVGDAEGEEMGDTGSEGIGDAGGEGIGDTGSESEADGAGNQADGAVRGPDDVESGGDDAGAEAGRAGEPGADSQVVGWVHVDAPELEKLRHTAELTVGVRSEFRGQGIGGRLLGRGLEWAADQGYRKVYQSVPATNEAAVEFLDGHDWHVEATREDHYLVDGDFVDEVMLARWVDEES